MPTTPSENKVLFNLKNTHYAVLTDGATPSWGTPVAVKGAVSLSLAPQGSVDKFYADGVAYFTSVANNGYEGDLEVARIPDSMLKDVWGMTAGATSKVLTEDSTVEPKPFALLFEIDGDSAEQLYVFYNCVGTRPAIASATNEESKQVQTMTTTITAAPLASGKVMARTTAETPTNTLTSWFTTVFVESST